MTVGNGVALHRAVAHVVVAVLGAVLLFVAAGVVAYLIAGPSGDIGVYVVAQSLLGLVALLAFTRWRAAVGLQAGLPAVWTGVPVLLAYLLLPSSWTATALFGWRLADPGLLTWGVDLLVWGAVVGLATVWAATDVPLREAPLTPYG